MTVTGWQWIDGKCYYFDNSSAENFGQMHRGHRTPDGYIVNTDGQWVNENGEVQTRADRGYVSNPAAAGTEAAQLEAVREVLAAAIQGDLKQRKFRKWRKYRR